jgi:hypothetical protein
MFCSWESRSMRIYLNYKRLIWLCDLKRLVQLYMSADISPIWLLIRKDPAQITYVLSIAPKDISDISFKT